MIALLAWCASAGVAGGATEIRSGQYSGKTEQETVADSARKIEFTVKKRKVTLTTEPIVARDLCLSPPVFTLNGETPKKPLSGRAAFSFTHTFVGSKIDKIRGQFVRPTKIEGVAVYNFPDSPSDLCTAGQEKVEFTANREKAKKK